jgi:hypothetical protein
MKGNKIMKKIIIAVITLIVLIIALKNPYFLPKNKIDNDNYSYKSFSEIKHESMSFNDNGFEIKTTFEVIDLIDGEEYRYTHYEIKRYNELNLLIEVEKGNEDSIYSLEKMNYEGNQLIKLEFFEDMTSDPSYIETYDYTYENDDVIRKNCTRVTKNEDVFTYSVDYIYEDDGKSYSTELNIGEISSKNE